MSEKVWETYEQVATYLLDRIREEIGLREVEGKQKVPGHCSGTDWEIDAKGIKSDGEGFVIIECRRHTTSAQNQERIAGLAYRIIDTGASGGIVVSPLGLQAGAKKVAEAEDILEVFLDPESTPQEFAMRFLNKLMIGVQDTTKISDRAIPTVRRLCAECGEEFEAKEKELVCPDCAIRASQE